MELVDLTREILLSLAKDKESVTVKEFATEEEDTILIQAMVSANDIGRIIGKDGKNIKAVRTLVQASSSLKENKRVKIEIDSF